MCENERYLELCIGCLTANCNMTNMISSGLLAPYQALTGFQDVEECMSEHKLCWECAALVNKFNTFRLKCETAYVLLRDLYSVQNKITNDTYKTINRKKLGLTSSIRLSETSFLSISEENSENSNEKDDHALVNEFSEAIFVQPKQEVNETWQYEDDFVAANLNEISDPEENGAIEKVRVKKTKVRSEKKKKSVRRKAEKTKALIRKKSKVKKEEIDETKGVIDEQKPANFELSEYVTIVTLTTEQQMEEIFKRKDSSNYKGASFKCELCFKGFVHEEAYANHMARHGPISGAHECPICRTRWKTEKKMSAHVGQVHAYKYICKLCPFSCQHKDQAHSHYKWHMGVKYKCEACGLEFDKKTTYLSHCRHKHPCAETCHICGDSFPTLFGLRHHIGMRHKDDETTLYCRDCDKHFTSSQARRRHLSSKVHIERTSKRKGCDSCDEKFTSQDDLNEHVQEKHTKDIMETEDGSAKRTYNCKDCDISFVSEEALTKHILTSYRHKDDKSRIENGCKHCGKKFPDRKSLKEHMRNVGAILEGPYECKHCGVTVQSRNKYYAHLAEHPGTARRGDRRARDAEQLCCEQCGEQMDSYRQYYVHFRRAHPHKTRTRYPHGKWAVMCDLCGKVFQHKFHLKLHIYKHTGERPYKCDVCNKTFNTPHYLEIHKKVHTDQRYACTICGQEFTQYSNLHRHQIVHSDAKPYTCDTCGKSFKLRSMLKSHTEYVHLKKPWPKRNRARARSELTPVE